MSVIRFRGFVSAALVLVLAACSGPGSSAAPSGAPVTNPPSEAPVSTAPSASPSEASFNLEVQALIDAAKEEGELTIILHDSAFNNHKNAAAFVDAFNAYYGLDASIDIQTAPGASGAPQVSQLLQEIESGLAPSTDLFMGPDNQIGALSKPEAAEPVDWRALDPNIPELAVNGYAVSYGTTYTGLTYATNFVTPEEAPKTLEDVLDPKWKGKVASTPFLSGFSSLARSSEWGPDRTLAYVEKLAPQVSGLIQANAWDRFASGEFLILAMNTGHFEVFQAKRDGLPVDFIFPEDALRLSYRSWLIPKGSAHPNLATLVALYTLTPEGQKFMFESDFLDLHFFPDSGTRALAAKYWDAGSTFYGEDGLVNGPQYSAEVRESGVLDKMRALLEAGS